MGNNSSFRPGPILQKKKIKKGEASPPAPPIDRAELPNAAPAARAALPISDSPREPVVGEEKVTDERLRAAARVFEQKSYKYGYVEHGGRMILASGFSIADHTVKLIVSTDDVLRAKFMIFDNSPESFRPKLGECCARANYGLKMGQFDIDWRDGETYYTMLVPLEDTTAQQVENNLFPRMLTVGISTLEDYVPAFLGVRNEGKEVVDAIKAVERADAVDDADVENEHLKACARHMKEHGINFSFFRSKDKIIIKCGFVLADHQTKVKVHAADVLKVRICIFSTTPESVRYELAEAVCRANFGFKVGHFDFDYNDGELDFEAVTPIEDMTPEDCEKCYLPTLLSTALSTTKKYIPAFLAIRNETKKAREAIRGVEGGSKGNAGSGDQLQQLLDLLRQAAGEAQQKQAAPQPTPAQQEMILDSSRLTSISKKLGQGGMGAVYACSYASLPVVAKEVLPGGDRARFMKEISLQAALNHPHIVGVQGIVKARIVPEGEVFNLMKDDNKFLMIAEYCEHGSLSQWLSDCRSGKRSYDEAQAVRLMQEVAVGMVFLHSKDMIHMDLKPDNIMINADMRAKVGDFGLAAKLEERAATQLLSGTMVGKFEGGTLDYIAPECFAEQITTRKSDVYAFGIILHNVFVTLDDRNTYDYREVLGPAGNVREYFKLLGQAVQRGMRPNLPSSASDSPVKLSSHVRDAVYSLMQRCWDGERRNRPTFDEIVDCLRILSKECDAKPKEDAPPLNIRPVEKVPSSENNIESRTGKKAPNQSFNSRKFLVLVKEILGIDAGANLKDAVATAIDELGIEEECAGIKSPIGKAEKVAHALGIYDECI